MLRTLVAGLFAAGLMFSVPLASDAAAQSKKAKAVQCKATGLDSKPVSWKCKKTEKCCFNPVLNLGTCSSAPTGCL
jgi:hypothetical protein